MTKEKRAIIGGMTAGVSKAVVLMFSVLQAPLLLPVLGKERFGVFVTVLSLFNLPVLLDFGIGAVLTNRISRSLVTQNRTAVRQYIGAAYIILFLAGGVLVGSGLAATGMLPWAKIFASGDLTVVADAQVASEFAMIFVGLLTVLQVVYKVFLGWQSSHYANLWQAASWTLGIGFLLYCSKLPGVTVGAVIFGVGTIQVLGVVGATLWFYKVFKQESAPQFSRRALVLWRPLLKASYPFFIIQIAGVLVFFKDYWVLAITLGPGAVTSYSMMYNLLVIGSAVPALFFAALWPAYAEAYYRRDFAWIKRTFTRVTVGGVVVCVAVLMVLFACGEPIMRQLSRGTVEFSGALFAFLATWFVINVVMGSISVLAGAIGLSKLQSGIAVLIAITATPGSFALVKYLGTAGPVTATILAYLVFGTPLVYLTLTRLRGSNA